MAEGASAGGRALSVPAGVLKAFLIQSVSQHCVIIILMSVHLRYVFNFSFWAEWNFFLPEIIFLPMTSHLDVATTAVEYKSTRFVKYSKLWYKDKCYKTFLA